ncbi:MAG TPA: nucleotide exchange factor GrpE [Gemmataceae bacterium]|jgi:molecular chaperone GrpE|nr:nucleotide exchange factor GrpE [Gemmataceae bacterium]
MNDPKTNAPEPREVEQPTAEGADAEQQAAAAVLDDLEALRSRLQSAEQERDQYLALLQRTRADFENYQKRLHRDLAQERRYASRPLALDLLPILDNLERAVSAAKQNNPGDPLLQGVAMVQAQFLDVLRRHGITPIEAQGKPFDPHLHEAVMQQPTADQPPGTVLQVLEQGFQMHDQVLRPARVVVSVAGQPPEGEAKEG